MPTHDADVAALFDQFGRERAAEIAAQGVPDVGALVAAEIDRRAAAAAVQEHAQRQAARAAGGPCAYCGAAYSVAIDNRERENATGEPEPWWRGTPLGPICIACADDRNDVDDITHRGAVAINLLGLERQWQPTQLGRRIANVFRWHAEITPRPPAPTDIAPRFSYVDRAALLAALAPPTPYRHAGPPCPACGATDAWVFEPSVLEAWRAGDQMVNTPTTPGDRCVCGHFVQVAGWRGADLAQAAADLGWLGGPLGSVDPLRTKTAR